jgi:hypothetical protein
MLKLEERQLIHDCRLNEVCTGNSRWTSEISSLYANVGGNWKIVVLVTNTLNLLRVSRSTAAVHRLLRATYRRVSHLQSVEMSLNERPMKAIFMQPGWQPVDTLDGCCCPYFVVVFVACSNQPPSIQQEKPRWGPSCDRAQSSQDLPH